MFKNLTKTQKGLYLVILTALISGFSVFINSLATKAIGNSHVFTTGKNLLVALILSIIVLTPFLFKKLQLLNKHQWLKLFIIGLIGGSIPFLLFFKGLTMSTSVNAAFIHKTLFIWVGILAVTFLKEKLTKLQLSALGLLLIGNFLLIGIKSWTFGLADLMILGATLFWAIEFVIAKKLLANIDYKIVAWARMFFGSIALLIFIASTNNLGALMSLEATQWGWISFTALLLLGYILTWYNSLSKLPATVCASILVVASPITTLLSNIFITNKYSIKTIVGSLIIVTATIVTFKILYSLKKHEKLAEQL